MKIRFSISLFIILVALAGCGANPTPSAVAPAPSAADAEPATAAPIATAPAAAPAGDQKVVIDSWGGSFQELQTKTILDPFQQQTGIQVVALSDGEAQLAKVKAQVTNNTPTIDLIHGDASWLFSGEREGLWAPIDYSVVDKTSVYSDVTEEYGLGILYWSFNIVYNTKAFPDKHPTTWAEVWAYAQANPGKVALWSARPNYVIEAALMADGLAPADVYPLNDEKLQRAFASLDKVKDKVRWYDTGAQGQKLFSDEEVVLGLFYGGDTFTLVDQGVPLQVEWNQGIYTRDYWLVTKNAPNRANAMKLLQFAARPDVQANFAKATSYGPIAKDAFSLIDDTKLLGRLPSWPQNKDKQLSYDYKWWGEHDEALTARWNDWLRK